MADYDFQEWYQGLCEIPNGNAAALLKPNHHAMLQGMMPDSRNISITQLMSEDEDLFANNSQYDDGTANKRKARNSPDLNEEMAMPSIRPNLSNSLSLEDYQGSLTAIHPASVGASEDKYSLHSHGSSSNPVGASSEAQTAFRLLIEEDASHVPIHPEDMIVASSFAVDASYNDGMKVSSHDLYMLQMQTPTSVPQRVIESPNIMFFNASDQFSHS